jgi:hypothetical protein
MSNVAQPLRLLLVQGITWVLLPLMFEGSIRLDVAEGVVGGPEWQLSYLRHPPLSTWLTGLASMTGPWRYATVCNRLPPDHPPLPNPVKGSFVRPKKGRPSALYINVPMRVASSLGC